MLLADPNAIRRAERDLRDTGSTIAQANDACGNLIQLTQLFWQG